MERVLLDHQSGARAGQCEIYPIARFQALYFGRGSECDVRFDADQELMVSRSHAVVEWDQQRPRRYILTDLVSSNGTFVNGQRLTGTCELKSGDEIQFGAGGPVVRFSLDQSAGELGRREVTKTVPNIKIDDTAAATLKRKLPDKG